MCINENDRPIASTGGGNEISSVGGLSKTTAITTALTAVIATTAADTLTAPSSSSASTVTTTHDHHERHEGSPNKGSHINSLSAGVDNGEVTGQGVVGLIVGSLDLDGSLPVSTVGIDTGIGTGVGLGARPTVGVAVGTGGIGGILTPTVRSNIASRSKEALQRHQERMEKRRLEKLHQQYQQLPNEQTH